MNGGSGVPEQLLKIPQWPSDLSSLRQTPKEIERSLKQLEDHLAEKWNELSFESDEFYKLSAYIGCFAALNNDLKSKLFSVIISGLGTVGKKLRVTDNITAEPIECMSILCFALVSSAEREQPPEVGNKKLKGATEWNYFKLALVEILRDISSSSPKIARLYQTKTDLEHLVGVFVKTTHLFLESQSNLKIAQLCTTCIEVLCNCYSDFGYVVGLKTVILQDLSYLEHLAEVNADLLTLICQRKNDTSLLDSVVEHVGSIRFSSDDTSSAKIMIPFLLRLATTNTKNILRNISSLADLMDVELYSVRMAMLEVFAVMYCHLMLQDDRTDQSKTQARSFLSAIEERMRDVNSFVRAKVLTVLIEMIKVNAIPITERARIVETVTGRIMDKSSNVRKRAIQLLGECICRHPFCVDGGELNLTFFENRLKEVDEQLDSLEPSEVKESINGSSENVNGTYEKAENLDSQMLQTLLMQKKYYSDALVFVKQLDSVIPLLCRLLSSSVKTEVFEVMDFFVDAKVYKLQSSDIGIRKMMHLIWEQDLSTEDGTKKSIKEHLLLCYKRVFLEVNASLNAQEKIFAISRALIELIGLSTTADLPSLEQIINGFVKKEWISDAVFNAIGMIFSSKTSSITEQRSSLIFLTMVGAHRVDVISSRIDTFLKVGLGQNACNDPWIAEYTCIALSLVSARIPNDNILFSRLLNLIKGAPSSPRWFQVISKAITALYKLAERPALITGQLIKELYRDLVANIGGRAQLPHLTKLVFIIGHVASSEVIHLANVEAHWKQSKFNSEMSKNLSSDGNMEGITATAEDDITDAIRFVRENELLFGQNSILASFGPLIADICSNNTLYNDPTLQMVSTLALTKLMTVSGRFCDQHLPLFLTILEKSPDHIIRANMTIAFADLAQAFGRIVDTNIVYLFRRLNDQNVTVKRNALMVLTHLTLTGLIKVKGQVGEIAKCILDDDNRIADLARLFFHELSIKDNVIYNHIPDIISSLSQGNETIPDEDFRKIIKFIFEYIKKERQMEGLAEKLCQRFRQCVNIRQVQDLSFCISLLNYSSERTVRKLIDSLPLYKDKLVDHIVFRNFTEALQKARKGCKAELRSALDEFEQAIIKTAGEETNLSEGFSKISINSHRNLASVKSKKNMKSANSRRKPSNKNEFPSDSEEEVSMAELMSDDNDEITVMPVKTSTSAKQRTAALRPARTRIIEEGSDDDIY